MNRKDWLWVSGLFVAILLVILATAGAEAAVYRQGSTGDAVKTIQTKLKRWGYYSGEIDGIYGSKTTAAVRYFQKTNGLAQDGICGAQTLKALGMSQERAQSSSGVTVSRDNDLYLLARAISAEARGGTLHRSGGCGSCDSQSHPTSILSRHGGRCDLSAPGLQLGG